MSAQENKRNAITRMVVFLIAYILVIVLFRAYRELVMPKLEPLTAPSVLTVVSRMLVPYAVIWPLLYVALLRRFEPRKVTAGKKPGAGLLVKLFVFQAACAALPIISHMVLHLISGEHVQASTANPAPDLSAMTLFILLVFNPVAEEIVVRRVTLDRLRILGDKPAILYSSFLFALMHVFSQGPAVAVMTFLVSLIWAFITIKSGRLVYAIILHALGNLYAFVLPQIAARTERGGMIYVLVATVIVPVVALILYLRDREVFAL